MEKVKDVVMPLNKSDLNACWFTGAAKIAPHYIETLHLHQGIGGVSFNALDDLKNLRAITVDTRNLYLESDGGILYLKDKLMLKRYPPAKKDKEFILPEETMYLEHRAFVWCCNLEKVWLNQNIDEIPMSAFLSCRSLKEMHIPETVKSIGTNAFKFCSQMTFYCPEGSFAEEYAASHHIPVVIENKPLSEKREKTDASVRCNVGPDKGGYSIREGLELFDTRPRIMPPFIHIDSIPPIYIGKFENGVYYKANHPERPFICSALEAYRIVKAAVSNKAEMWYRSTGWEGLKKDYRMEYEQELHKKKQKTQER